MANTGKFIDRYPLICAAGKSTGIPEETVGTTLRQYPIDDAVAALKHQAKIWREDVFVPPRTLPPYKNAAFLGNNTQIKPILNPPVNTRFQELIENLKETPYYSFWNQPLGTVRDPTPGLPAGAVPVDITFGKPTYRETTVKELVNPPKKHYQVMWDSQVGHQNYIKTHNDYNPSERIDRKYNVPPYNSNKRFGMKSGIDPRGLWVRCCCDWHKKEPVVFASKIQADYLDRAKPMLGRPLTPNHVLDIVPKGKIFGKKSAREFFGVEDLLKDPTCPPCVFKRDFLEWLSTLNRYRLLIKKRCNKGFNFEDFYQKCLYWDKERTGFLPIEVFYDQCVCERLTYPKEHVESLLKLLNIIVDDKINYRGFIDILNSNKPPIEIMPFNDVPRQNQYYVTTSQAAVCDYLIVNNAEMHTAGLPSRRHDLPRPIKPYEGCRAEIDHYGEDSTGTTVLSPSIYTNYGLTHRDFFQPRTAETMKTLFEKVGYNFPGDTFDKMWKEGLERDKTGFVCVDTFKTLVKKCCPPPKVLVDEQECDTI